MRQATAHGAVLRSYLPVLMAGNVSGSPRTPEQVLGRQRPRTADSYNTDRD